MNEQNHPTPGTVASKRCALCGSHGDSELCKVYMGLLEYYKDSKVVGANQHTVKVTSVTHIQPANFYLCRDCIEMKSADLITRGRRSLFCCGAALVGVLVLWLLWSRFIPAHSSLETWSGIALFFVSCITVSMFYVEWQGLSRNRASGKPAAAAKNVCFEVCKTDYDVLLQEAKNLKREKRMQHDTATVDVMCYTPLELRKMQERFANTLK